MIDNQFDDLKELVQTTAANTEANLRKDLVKTEMNIRKDLRRAKTGLIARMDNGFAGVGGAMSNLSDHIAERFNKVEEKLTDHERRITKLEQAA